MRLADNDVQSRDRRTPLMSSDRRSILVERSVRIGPIFSTLFWSSPRILIFYPSPNGLHNFNRKKLFLIFEGIQNMILTFVVPVVVYAGSGVLLDRWENERRVCIFQVW